MAQTEENLKQTPLYKQHVALGARMVPFGGWDMPVQYEGILAEHAQTRKAAAIFDVSHMGEFMIEGGLKESGLDRIVTMPLADLALNSCRYGFLLNDNGGVIDDLIVFRLEDKKWFIVVNASTTGKDAKQFQQHLTKEAAFKDISLQTGKVDLQGPRSREVLSRLVPDINKLEFYSFDFFSLLGERVLISRTGYTGELGYEIFFPWERTEELWKTLLAYPEVKPAGLGARDVLRLEVGYSLYGHELNEATTPLEAGLGKFVDLTKDFIGKEALLRQQKEGLKRRLIGFTSDTRRSPREKHQLFDHNERPVGIVTSGSYSPICERGIGLGFVENSLAKPGEKIYFGDVNQKNSAMISSKIFYKKGSLKD